jgi:hypothetical protein
MPISESGNGERLPYTFCGLKYCDRKWVLKGKWMKCQECKKQFHEVCVLRVDHDLSVENLCKSMSKMSDLNSDQNSPAYFSELWLYKLFHFFKKRCCIPSVKCYSFLYCMNVYLIFIITFQNIVYVHGFLPLNI